MIARFTRIMLALQIIAVSGIAGLLLKMNWISQPVLAVAASTLLLTLPRVAVVFNNFFLSSALRQPLHNGAEPDLFACSRLMLAELYASTLCWLWLLPFATFRRRMQAGDTSLPVLLIHGYGANSGYWHHSSKLLARAGISHQALELEPILASIDDYAALIHQAVEALCKETRAEQVIMLAHSMGGLAARAYLKAQGSNRMAKLITLGTPHFGSTLANFAMGINATQMQRAAPQWLTTLAQSETPALRARFVSIYSRHDNIVAPQASAHLPGASNIEFDLIGHVALGFDARVLERVMQEITAARQNKS